MSKFSEHLRKSFLKNDKTRDKGLTTPNNIHRINDIVYGPDPKYQILDIYEPSNKVNQVLPVIVNIHGGGFVYGFKETYQFYCMSLAQKGFRVVNFSYRLAPEVKYPAQLEDVNSVFKWIVKHKDEYHFDLNNLFAIGDSAGANLLGIYAGLITNKEVHNLYNFDLADITLKAIALNHGCYNTEIRHKEDTITPEVMKDLFENRGTPEEVRLLTVENYVSSNYPPVFLVTSSGDFLKNQSIEFIPVLAKYNIPFIFRFFSRRSVDLDHVFHLNIQDREARDCNEEECNFFKSFISD